MDTTAAATPPRDQIHRRSPVLCLVPLKPELFLENGSEQLERVLWQAMPRSADDRSLPSLLQQKFSCVNLLLKYGTIETGSCKDSNRRTRARLQRLIKSAATRTASSGKNRKDLVHVAVGCCKRS